MNKQPQSFYSQDESSPSLIKKKIPKSNTLRRYISLGSEEISFSQTYKGDCNWEVIEEMNANKQKEKEELESRIKNRVIAITEIEIREQCEINWDKQPMERKRVSKKDRELALNQIKRKISLEEKDYMTLKFQADNQ